MKIVIAFVGALVFFLCGVLVLAGRYRYIVPTDEAGTPSLSRLEIRVFGVTGIVVGALIAITAGLSLFTDRPYMLVDFVFSLFT